MSLCAPKELMESLVLEAVLMNDILELLRHLSRDLKKKEKKNVWYFWTEYEKKKKREFWVKWSVSFCRFAFSTLYTTFLKSSEFGFCSVRQTCLVELVTSLHLRVQILIFVLITLITFSLQPGSSDFKTSHRFIFDHPFSHWTQS